MLIITPLERRLELYRDQIPTRPSASVGTGWNETAGKTTTFTRGLLRIQRFSISRKIRRYIRERNPYAIVDMEDLGYTIRKGRYSDKQTIISDSGSHVAFRYRTDTRLVLLQDLEFFSNLFIAINILTTLEYPYTPSLHPSPQHQLSPSTSKLLAHIASSHFIHR